MISVVIITKNEQDNILACIETASWADEIIIVDAQSTDATRDIARKYSDKVKIFVKKWEGYGKAKNFGIKQAKSEWIVSLDADERITASLRHEIKNAIRENNFDGFRIPRLLYFCGHPVRRGGCYPDWQLRLFRKGYGYYGDEEVHERFNLKGKVGYLKNYMLHYSYKTMFDYWQRFNIYTELDAKKKYRHKRKFSIFCVLILPWEVFRRLIIKRGIFDGVPGLFYHIFSATSSFVKYTKLWELYYNK